MTNETTLHQIIEAKEELYKNIELAIQDYSKKTNGLIPNVNVGKNHISSQIGNWYEVSIKITQEL